MVFIASIYDDIFPRLTSILPIIVPYVVFTFDTLLNMVSMESFVALFLSMTFLWYELTSLI